MALRLDQLPPNLRAQVVQADPAKRQRNRKGAGVTRTDGRCQCGERFTSTVAWERHSDSTGHRRFVLIGGAA